MKRSIIGLLGFALLAAGSTHAVTTAETPKQASAAEIMQLVDDRYRGESYTTETHFIQIDKKGRQRIKSSKSFMKKYGEDEKDIAVFFSPADISGTGFLNHHWDDPNRENDIWMYIPAISKTKRLPVADRSGSFLGTDFAIADFESKKLHYYDYKFLSEDKVIDGHEVLEIEELPKDEFKERVLEETGYIKSVYWIRKDLNFIVRSKHWVQKGEKIKFFTASEIEEIDGVWFAKQKEMQTHVKGEMQSKTVMKVTSVKFNVNPDDALFAIQQLERGI